MFPRTRSLVVALLAAVPIAACERVADQLSANNFPSVPERTTTVASAPSPSGARSEANAAPAPSSPSSSAPVSMDAISDSVITARIKAAILSDPGMSGADVSVNTNRGVVNLTGVVRSPEQAAIASAYAQRQDGVVRVDSQLSPNPQ